MKAPFVSFRSAKTLWNHLVRAVKYILQKKGWLDQENISETVVKFVSMMWKQTPFNAL